MNATTDKLAIVRRTLPYVDRRALSEAWYAALHVARDGRLRVPARRCADAAAPASTRAPRAPSAATSGARVPPASRTLAARAAPPPAPAPPARAPERVRPPARTLPAALAATRPHAEAPFARMLTVSLAGARVRIFVRRDGDVLRIVALCEERHADAVRRALACADLHLRARGERVASAVRADTGDVR